MLGDPFQLPPVKGGGYFTEAAPDVMLTEIHRQAADNPIIRLSQIVRSGGELPEGDYGETPRHPPRRDRRGRRCSPPTRCWSASTAPAAPTTSGCATLNGFNEPLPVAGDRLVCLRNDRTKGLINGGLWRVEALGGVQKDFVSMTVRPEDEGASKPVKVAVLKHFFEGTEGELAYLLRRESDEFDYGYALTVHKAQGSQWDDVDAVRRKLRLPRAPGALALHRPHAGGEAADGGAVTWPRRTQGRGSNQRLGRR